MPSLCRTKHNRAKPMSESASALFSIADAGEFRFARFYIVCEEVPLGTPESPPIVSGVSDMHPSDCPNVEETRNPMQTFSRKKCSHFSPTNIPSAFPHEIPKCILIILLIPKKSSMLMRQSSSVISPLIPPREESRSQTRSLPYLPRSRCSRQANRIPAGRRP